MNEIKRGDLFIHSSPHINIISVSVARSFMPRHVTSTPPNNRASSTRRPWTPRRSTTCWAGTSFRRSRPPTWRGRPPWPRVRGLYMNIILMCGCGCGCGRLSLAGWACIYRVYVLISSVLISSAVGTAAAVAAAAAGQLLLARDIALPRPQCHPPIDPSIHPSIPIPLYSRPPHQHPRAHGGAGLHLLQRRHLLGGREDPQCMSVA